MISSRQEAFDSFALDYDCYRPEYPADVIARVLDRANVTRGSKVLEVGCGSGQATLALVEAGLDVTAVDPGASLLEIAAKKHPQVRWVVARFEDFAPNEALPCFDFALSATAFHWVNQSVGYRKLHEMLRKDALFANISLARHWPESLRKDLDLLYSKYSSDFESVSSSFGGAESRADDAQALPYFEVESPVTADFEIGHTADTYVGLMKTMSDHRLLPDGVQGSFFGELHRICADHGSFVLRHSMSAKLFRRK